MRDLMNEFEPMNAIYLDTEIQGCITCAGVVLVAGTDIDCVGREGLVVEKKDMRKHAAVVLFSFGL